MSLSELTNKIFDKRFRFIFLILVFAELASLCGYFVLPINSLGFFVILAIALILSLKNLKYGVYLALAELFIGSKGYLFCFEACGTAISLRLGLWLAVMAVWLAKSILARSSGRNKDWLRSCWPFFILFIFIAWGFLNGLFNGNGFNNIFFDANGWLYFLLLFPIFEVAGKEENFNRNFLRIFFASTFWLALKTLILLFIFSHNLAAAGKIYDWVRITGVGEITNTNYGFIRIFFQSHVFILLGIFMILFIFNHFVFGKKDKPAWPYFAMLILFSAIAVSGFSRSFWAGLALALLFYAGLAWKKYGCKNLLKTLLVFALAFILSIGLIAAVIKFPYPRPGQFNLSALAERVKIKNEPGASSRYALLPPLWEKIKSAPILGRGFGATATYKTSDPRILETTADGYYTTYAFEWGWLDIWLKFGFLGLLFYLFLIGKIIKDGFFADNWFSPSLAVGLVFLSATSIFSPYLNHPLGIGFIILAAAIIKLSPPLQGGD
jgi:O-antigen ligase